MNNTPNVNVSMVSLPVTRLQRNLLNQYINDPKSDVYLQQLIIDFAQEIAPDDLELKVNALVKKHIALRTSFKWSDPRHPTQHISEGIKVPWELIDLSASPPNAINLKWGWILEVDQMKLFDLSKPPLLRFTLVKLARNSWRLVWTFHHIILDGYSQLIFIKALLSKDAVEPYSITDPYEDFLIWQEKQISINEDAHKKFWIKLLNEAQPPPLLPWEKSNYLPTKSDSKTITFSQTYDSDLTKLLRHRANEIGCSIHTLVHGAWALTLGLFTNSQDITFGTIRSGRRGHVDQTMTAIGLFITTVPFRIKIDSEVLVKDWLLNIKKQQISIREHEHAPWVPSHLSEFSSLVVCQNFQLEGAIRTSNSNNWNISYLDLCEKSNIPLILSFKAEENSTLSLAGDSNRIDPWIIKQLQERAAHLIETLSENFDSKLSDIPLISIDERERLKNTRQESHRPILYGPYLHSGFTKAALIYPTHICINDGHTTWSYQDLDRYSNQVASYLIQCGVGSNTIVGLYIEKSAMLLAIIIGILKTGAAYLPIDRSNPFIRALWMAEKAKTALLITDALPLLNSKSDQLNIHDLSILWKIILRESIELIPSNTIKGDSLAYTIFTSGSSGEPKLVGVEHRQITNLIDYALREIFSKDDLQVVPFIDSIGFDSSVHQIFTTLSSGGMLVVFKDLTEAVSSDWGKKYTSLGTTPSILMALLSSGAKLMSIRVPGLGGEKIPHKLLGKLATFPNINKAFNYYGPTETTVYSTVHSLMDKFNHERFGTTSQIVGKPIQNTYISILDEYRRPVPSGAVGEIYIAGAGVSRGYIDDPEFTSLRFTEDPYSSDQYKLRYQTGDLGRLLPDGCLEFLGRSDSQVKLRGIRIDLSEIDRCLLNFEKITHTVSVLHQDSSRLISYVVTDKNVSISEIYDYLQGQLPNAMIPSRIIWIEKMPLTSSGKIDEKKLPIPIWETIDPQETLNLTEKKLEKIWCKALNVESIGRDERFVDLGGDSLLAIMVIANIEKVFKRRIPASSFIEAPTLALMSNLINLRSSPPPALVPFQALGTKNPIFCLPLNNGDVQCYEHFAKALGVTRPVFGLRAHSIGKLHHDIKTFENLAKYYCHQIRLQQPIGPYTLAGYSIAGWLAYAVAQELEDQNQKIQLLTIIDTRFTPKISLFLKPIDYISKLLQRIYFHHYHLRQLNYSARLLYIQKSIGRFYIRVKSSNIILPNQLEEEKLSYINILLNYRPKRILGNLTIIISQETLVSSLWIWKILTRGRARTRRTEGDHASIMQLPQSASLANILDMSLNETFTKNNNTN
jgi:amino acid adenylation domain-containing protein